MVIPITHVIIWKMDHYSWNEIIQFIIIERKTKDLHKIDYFLCSHWMIADVSDNLIFILLSDTSFCEPYYLRRWEIEPNEFMENEKKSLF